MLNTTFRSQTSGVREWPILAWLRGAERVLFGRAACAVAACLTVLIILGCMTNNYCSMPEGVSEADGILTQTGEASLPGSSEQFIYYPVPYSSPPNLELEGTLNYFKLLEQKADGFRIRNEYSLTHSVTWKARGQRIPPSNR